jgi:hypothetical protein
MIAVRRERQPARRGDLREAVDARAPERSAIDLLQRGDVRANALEERADRGEVSLDSAAPEERAGNGDARSVSDVEGHHAKRTMRCGHAEQRCVAG